MFFLFFRETEILGNVTCDQCDLLEISFNTLNVKLLCAKNGHISPVNRYKFHVTFSLENCLLNRLWPKMIKRAM